MSKILVLGGTGFVGRSLCSRLVDRSGGADGSIVVPSRRPSRARHIQFLPTVRLAEADVHDEAQLARLVAGCDAVVNLVAILHGSAADFQRTHVDLPAKLARVCQAANVKRVVHVSALGVSDRAPSRYLRSKTAGELMLKSAKLDLTVLRPSVIFGEHDKLLNLFASLQAVFPVVPLGGAAAQFQPVWVEDVAAAIVRCLDEPATIGHTYECTGPRVYTLKELVELAGSLSGHPRPVVPLPDGLTRLQAAAMEWLPGTPLMSRDNVDSMKVPNVATGQWPGLPALGITPAALDAIAPLYLGAGQGPARLDPWRAKAGRG
ncbi:MAG: NAD-dependent dehydratase [Methylibium sp. NZG]|nr:MAG: NAD-dependent dehydratase [Methylibium sp. NZG]